VIELITVFCPLYPDTLEQNRKPHRSVETFAALNVNVKVDVRFRRVSGVSAFCNLVAAFYLLANFYFYALLNTIR